MKFINPDTVSVPKGHYSPAVVHNGIVYVAGQLAIDREGNPRKESIEEETAQCLHNVEQILTAAGSGLNQVLKMNIFVSDISLWPRINAEYARILGGHKPARIVVPSKELNYGCHVEIDCIAAVNP